MLFFKVLVLLLVADSYEISPPQGLPFEAPKALQQIDEIMTIHLFAFAHCIKGFDFSEGEDTTDEFGTDQSENSTTNCFSECVLSNIDMMNDGHLEYVGSEENVILKDAFDSCSKKEIMKKVEGCLLAHLFLRCELTIFLEKAIIDLFSFNEVVIEINSLLTDLKTKIDILKNNILNMYH